MNKSLILVLVLGIILANRVFAETVCGIGADVVKDPYNKKVFVRQLVQNAPAVNAGLPNGAEIVTVDGQKVKKLTIEQISELIRGEAGTVVNLGIKYNKVSSDIAITRAAFDIPKKKEDRFEIHWKQVAPVDKYIGDIPDNMKKYMSSRWYYEVVPTANYWQNRKAEFKNGYDACMTYPVGEQNACLMNLTNREINKTAQDRQNIIQENIMHEQMMMNNHLRNMEFNMRNVNNRLWY